MYARLLGITDDVGTVGKGRDLFSNLRSGEFFRALIYSSYLRGRAEKLRDICKENA